MPGPRKLWTGAFGMALRDRAIERFSAESPSLWLVPSPIAREQMTRLLTLGTRSIEPPRVWCWKDAWEVIARRLDDPPARLSKAGQTAVLTEAIERALRAGDLVLLKDAVRWAGYRRQLLGRFAAWTRIERPIEAAPPSDSPLEIEEWALFGHYRAILEQIGADDPESWVSRISRQLLIKPPSELRKPGQVVVIDPAAPGPAGWRLIEFCHRRARSMIVTLPFDPDPALAELYACIEPIRQQLLTLGFVEETEKPNLLNRRPRGLDAIERDLFRADSHTQPGLNIPADQGLKILGGPQGDGIGLLVTREVRDHLDRGIPPEEILVLFPRLDEEAERIRDALRSWDLPVGPGRERRLATIPALSALRMAMRLPVEGWEVATLVQLLRNGQIRWTDLEAASPFARFEAASVLQATRIFRDREALREALARAVEDPKADSRTTKLGLRAIDQLSAEIDVIIGSGPWNAQVARARRLAGALGLNLARIGAALGWARRSGLGEGQARRGDRRRVPLVGRIRRQS